MKEGFYSDMESLIDKHRLKSPFDKKTLLNIFEVTKKCSDHFGSPERAIAACLMSLGNLTKRLAEVCSKHKDENAWLEAKEDLTLRMTMDFALALMQARHPDYPRHD